MSDPASTLAFTGIVAKTLIKSITKDLYAIAKAEGGFHLKKWIAARHVDTVYRHVRELRLVKTIWQLDKAVDLLAFFHPPKVYVDEGRASINQLADLGYEGNIILEGTVGQGKSILLRYLAATDFYLNRRIPIFLELRKARHGQSLEDLSLLELNTLGFAMNEEVFAFFANKGRLVLFLDAFDEAKEELKQELIANIERLIRQYAALTVVVTSRPDSGISASPFLRVFTVSELQENEHEAVIRKMAHDPQTADAIIKGIRADSYQVAHLLRTPLMVALLMVRYRIDHSLPQNAAAFYESLFSLLLQRHDKSKGGWQRPRRSGASDSTLLEFFNALAFISRKAGDTSFTQTQLRNYSRKALDTLGEKLDADKMIDDIVIITCLIIRDGEEYRFIHKSVQEYHSALFVKEQPDHAASRFYHAMRSQFSAWEQEIRFLRQIDRYRYTKQFCIPLLTSILNGSDDLSAPIPEFTVEVATRLFGDDAVGFVVGRQLTRITHRLSWSPAIFSSSVNIPYFSALSEVPIEEVPVELITEARGLREVLVRDVFGLQSLGSKLFDAARQTFYNMKSELEDAKAYVVHTEATTELFDFPTDNSQ
jgi:hypothetical protein